MPVNKRDLMLSLLDDTKTQTMVPAGFFLHFGREYHRGQAAVDKHVEFFRFTGMDFVKVQFELEFPQVSIQSPADWATIPRLDRAFFENQLGVVRGLVAALGGEALVLLTLYSPYMILAHIVGSDRLNQDAQTNWPAVRPVMERVTEDTIAFVRDCVAAGLDGFYHSTQGGEDRRFPIDPAAFDRAVKPYDLAVMKEIERTCRFNILHICDYHRDLYGGYSDLGKFVDYPGHVVNCSTEGQEAQAISELFSRPFMGGMDRTGPLASGSPGDARREARAAIASRSERYVLAADCTVPANTPWENLRAAIEEAHTPGLTS